MKKLTVIIITKNEEDVISDAVKSAKDIAEEILVIDANSTDRTSEWASKLGAKVIKHQFRDFSDQRNFGFLHAKSPWILYLDADERLTNEFKSEVSKLIDSNNEAYAGFYIRRKTFYYGRDWNFIDRVQRLFLKDKFIEWFGVVHETPKVKGEFGEIKSPIIHLTHRNLSQMLRKTNEWSEYEAKLRLASSHPKLVPWRFVRVMVTEFFNSYVKNKGYKNGTLGLIEGLYQAFSIFITYAKLWEMQNKN